MRDFFVMASLDQYLEYEYLGRILLDAVRDELAAYDEATVGQFAETHQGERYQKYQKEKYEPQPHSKRED